MHCGYGSRVCSSRDDSMFPLRILLPRATASQFLERSLMVRSRRTFRGAFYVGRRSGGMR